MPVEAQFNRVAEQMCHLLGCASAHVLLGCQEQALRHPLLDLLSTMSYGPLAYAGLSSSVDFLQDARLRALCDLAIQTGLLQSIDDCHIQSAGTTLRSLTIVPLERPAGVLGLCVLGDTQAGAFSAGEHLLLRQYVPRVTRDLERMLRDLCAVPFYPNVRSGAGVSPDDSRALSPGARALRQRGAALQTREDTGLERQRLELDRLKSDFIAMVSHELRTPLTAIKGYAVLLHTYGMAGELQAGGRDSAEGAESGAAGVAGAMSPARQREYLDIIMEQTDHLEVLISDLLDVSRIHAGRLALRLREVDLAPLCQRVVQLIQQRVDQQYPQRYTLDLRLAPDLPPTWSDPDRVQQVLINLLENGVKYSPAGGPIDVIVARHAPASEGSAVISPGAQQTGAFGQAAEMVSVTVRDQGIGIAPEQLPYLFKPFSRLEHPRAGGVPGAGLGLYITQKLVEAMRGSVTLSSRVGAGTSVTFHLPTAPQEGASSSAWAPLSAP